MATPMTPATFLVVLRDEGVHVTEHPGWETHNRNGHGGWGPMNGVLIHHTGGVGPSDGVTVWTGRTGLPGPLAHSYLAKGGVCTMISSGRANHAGGGDPAVLAAVVNEQPLPRPRYGEGDPGAADGNAHFYGLEISNLGNGKDPYPDIQYSQAVRWASAICRHYKWTEKSVLGHKEWSDQKVDPSFDMAVFRNAVAARLAHPASWNPEEDEMTDAEMTALTKKLWGYMNQAAGDKHDMHQAVANIEKGVAALAAQVKALDAKVAKYGG